MSKIIGKIKEINWVTSSQYDCLNRDCPICRNSLDEDKKDVLIGVCGHGYHKKCINNWHNSSDKNTCPVCNKRWLYK